jgi:hypothetical protein
VARQLPLSNVKRGHGMFGFYSNRLGCIGSIVVSLIGTLILIAAMRSCSY